MRPILFSWGEWHLISYGVFMTLAYAVGIGVLRHHQRRLRLSGEQFWNYVLCGMVGALAGGYLGALIFYQSAGLSQLLANIRAGRGGFSFYHGFWGGATLGYVYCRRAGLDVPTVADVTACALPLAHAIGRVGCFLAGCCLGRPTDRPWAVVYPGWSPLIPPALRGVPVHPVQLYEVVGNLLIASWLNRRLAGGGGRPGSTFWLYILSYAALRFVADPLRATVGVPPRGPLTMGQWSALLSAAAALWFLNRPRPQLVGNT